MVGWNLHALLCVCVCVQLVFVTSLSVCMGPCGGATVADATRVMYIHPLQSALMGFDGIPLIVCYL